MQRLGLVGAVEDVQFAEALVVLVADRDYCHARSPTVMVHRAVGGAMTRKRGISFTDATDERMQASAGDDPISPLVEHWCRLGLDAEAELAKRGIIIDDADERREAILDALEAGLDASEW